MNEYTTVNGIVIKLRPMSAKLRDVLGAKYKPPKVPTYEVPNQAGDITVYEHNETTLDTEEDKAIWAQYLKDKGAVDLAFGDLVIETYVKFGTNYTELLPANDDWVAVQEEFGIEVPKDPKARQIHYFRTEILVSDADLNRMMANVRSLSTEGRMLGIEEAEASFRSTVEKWRKDVAGRNEGDSVDTATGPEVGSGEVGS